MLRARPAISKIERVGLLLGALPPRIFVGPHDDVHVDESYAWCVDVARRAGQELLLFLPAAFDAAARRAMCAIYAFMRYCDDLSDDEGIADRAAAIARWRDGSGCGAQRARIRDHPLWPAFVDAVERYQNPAPVFLRHDRRRQLATWSRAASKPSMNSTITAITWPAWLASPSFTFSASMIPKRWSWPKNAASRFSSPTFCAMCARMPKKIASIIPAEDFERFGVSPETLVPRDRLLRTDGVRGATRARVLPRIGAAGANDPSREPRVACGR